jgi:phosphatidylethanolamine/phosphatidyl-N-methylethanolamine N-methyltransferase
MISNRWRRFTYTLWAPFYDLIARVFNRKRARSLELLTLRAGERVLIVGAGTGLDLPFVNPEAQITAVDLTPAMIRRLETRSKKLGVQVQAKIMDAHALEFDAEGFDAVILHLIVAVVPDPFRCVQEAARVLRRGGRLVILDKFVPDTRQPSIWQRLVGPLASVLGTEVSRKLGPILEQVPSLQVVHDESAGLSGYFRIVLLQKRQVS